MNTDPECGYKSANLVNLVGWGEGRGCEEGEGGQVSEDLKLKRYKRLFQVLGFIQTIFLSPNTKLEPKGPHDHFASVKGGNSVQTRLGKLFPLKDSSTMFVFGQLVPTVIVMVCSYCTIQHVFQVNIVKFQALWW